MDIRYGKIKVDGQSLTPLQASQKPNIQFQGDPNILYTLILADPNAVKGYRVHWLIINIPGSSLEKGQPIFEYDGPHPPPNSGIHNYIFYLFEQKSRIPIQNTIIKTRYILLKELLKKLNIFHEPLYTDYFTSHNPLNNVKNKTKKRKSKNKNKSKNKGKKTRKH
jgi:hypothetical protein